MFTLTTTVRIDSRHQELEIMKKQKTSLNVGKASDKETSAFTSYAALLITWKGGVAYCLALT